VVEFPHDRLVRGDILAAMLGVTSESPESAPVLHESAS
jgi:hypothetical protein